MDRQAIDQEALDYYRALYGDEFARGLCEDAPAKIKRKLKQTAARDPSGRTRTAAELDAVKAEFQVLGHGKTAAGIGLDLLAVVDGVPSAHHVVVAEGGKLASWTTAALGRRGESLTDGGARKESTPFVTNAPKSSSSMAVDPAKKQKGATPNNEGQYQSTPKAKAHKDSTLVPDGKPKQTANEPQASKPVPKTKLNNEGAYVQGKPKGSS